MRASRRALLAVAAGALTRPALAQEAPWPNRPVRLVVAFGAGGSLDLIARTLGRHFETVFGVPFPVENRTGAGGQIGTGNVARSPGDGYSLLVTSSANHGVAPSLYPNLPYDPVRDFSHIGLISSGPNVLVTNAATSPPTLREFVDKARSSGQPVTYGSGGIGTLGHLTGQLMAQSFGVPFQHISYRGSAAAQADLLAGNVMAVSDNLSSHAAPYRAGALRVLGIASPERLPGFEGIPTFREQGYDLVAQAWYALCGSPGMAPAVVERINAAMRDAIAAPEMSAMLREMAMQPEGRMSPAEYAAFVRAEVARWGTVVRSANVRVD